MAKSLKIKINYGILSGERVHKRLLLEIRNAGYEITSEQSNADIIIGHSAGCFWLDGAAPKQKLFLIDPPYWPDRQIAERGKARVKSNFHYKRHGYSFMRWLKRNMWGAFYLFYDFGRTRKIAKYAADFDLKKLITGRHVLLVRNTHDDWLTPDIHDLLAINPKLIFREMSGDHDDWYHNPKPYVDLIKLLLDKAS